MDSRIQKRPKEKRLQDGKEERDGLGDPSG
jgi:hypothetical protein